MIDYLLYVLRHMIPIVVATVTRVISKGRKESMHIAA